MATEFYTYSGGGKWFSAPLCIEVSIIVAILFIWFLVIIIRYRKAIFQNKWSIIPVAIILIFNIRVLTVLYYSIYYDLAINHFR